MLLYTHWTIIVVVYIILKFCMLNLHDKKATTYIVSAEKKLQRTKEENKAYSTCEGKHAKDSPVLLYKIE